MAPLPVLLYHGLHTGVDEQVRFDGRYSVKPESFSSQLDWLIADGWTTTRLDEAGTSESISGKQVVLTFDDGDASHIDVALPYLLDRGMVAEFFIITQGIGKKRLMSANDLRALVSAGMGVQSHTHTHNSLETLEGQKLEQEIEGSKHILEGITGSPVTALSLPGGRGGERVRDLAFRSGYRHVLGSTLGVNRHRSRQHVLNRLCIERHYGAGDFERLVSWRGIGPLLLRLRKVRGLLRRF